MTTMFAVSKNGAVWKNHYRVEQAMEQASLIASGDRTYQIQEFDQQGQSAVVEKPVTVRVELMHYDSSRRQWNFVANVAEWVRGERIL